MERETIKVEKNIPIPSSMNKQNNRLYPFESMEKGDSFFVKLKAGKKRNVLQSSLNVCAKAFILRYKLNWKFQIRSQWDGVRIWRIE